MEQKPSNAFSAEILSQDISKIILGTFRDHDHLTRSMAQYYNSKSWDNPELLNIQKEVNKFFNQLIEKISNSLKTVSVEDRQKVLDVLRQALSNTDIFKDEAGEGIIDEGKTFFQSVYEKLILKSLEK